MVTVTTHPPLHTHANLAADMCETMQTVPSITPRSKQAIISLLKAGNIALAFDGDTLVGWLVAMPYSSRVQELGMAYIKPEYRGRGILNRMIKPLIDRHTISLAVTYELRLANLLIDRWGFAPSSLAHFAYCSRGLFILSRLRSVRAIRAVTSHITTRKPIYLVRSDDE